MLTRVISLGVAQQELEPGACQPERVASFRAPPGLLRAVSSIALGDTAEPAGFVDVTYRFAASAVPVQGLPAPHSSVLPAAALQPSLATASHLAYLYGVKTAVTLAYGGCEPWYAAHMASERIAGCTRMTTAFWSVSRRRPMRRQPMPARPPGTWRSRRACLLRTATPP